MSQHYIIYDDAGPRRPFTGRIGDPCVAYIRHYSNLMELQRACKVYEGLMRWRAERELIICQGKLEWWSHRPGFSLSQVLPEINRLKKLWSA